RRLPPTARRASASSRQVTRLRRSGARLRLAEQADEIVVRKLGQRLVAPARSQRRVARHPQLAILPFTRDEEEREFIVIVLSHATGGHYPPFAAGDVDGTVGHHSSSTSW